MLRQDRGGRNRDPELARTRERDTRDRVVARIATLDKPARHRAAEHRDPQPAMGQRLIVVCDRLAIDRGHAERTRDLCCIIALRQLPQAAEQAVWSPSREHDLAARFDPQRRTGEHRQLARAFAFGDHGELVVTPRSRGDAVRGERAGEASR